MKKLLLFVALLFIPQISTAKTCSLINTNTTDGKYYTRTLEPKELQCFYAKSFSSYLSVATVKKVGGDGDAFVDIYERESGKPVGEGALVPFSNLENNDYILYLVNSSKTADVSVEIIVHSVGIEEAIEGALWGLGQTVVENAIASFLGLDNNNDDYFSAGNNVSRVLTITTSAVQGNNLAKTSVASIANEFAIGLRKAGVSNGVANIFVGAISSYVGEMYKFY